MSFRIIFKRLLLLLPVLSFIFVSCDIKQGTLGAQDRIFVVTDSLFWLKVGDSVRTVFEREIMTPHSELTYHITPIPLSKLNAFNDRMNIFIIGQTGGESTVDKYLAKSLPAKFRERHQDGNYYYFFNDDMFARDQIGMIMMASDAEQFLEMLRREKNAIYEKFDKKYYQRLHKTIFERDENGKLEDYLTETFGWHVRLTQDYFVALPDLENKFVWLRRIHPNRWLSIWESAGRPELNSQGMVAERNRMAKKYYQGDIVVPGDYTVQPASLNSRPAVKMVGVWKNDSLLVGGPFRTYARYDSIRNKTYFVDIAVLAPGKLKKPFLDQLEVLANTFTLDDTPENK